MHEGPLYSKVDELLIAAFFSGYLLKWMSDRQVPSHSALNPDIPILVLNPQLYTLNHKT